MTFRFVITGAPRTKKTSQRLVRTKRGALILPSAPYAEWFKQALWQAVASKREYACFPIQGPVGVKALIYREANTGDATGFYQAIGDFLQAPRPPKGGFRGRAGAGFILDDKQIVHWDGSRLLIDREHPRLDITLEWPT